MRRRVAFLGIGAIGAFFLTLLVSPLRVEAATTYTVGVDNASPAGHNFQYTTFYPNAGFTVHSGDTIDFKWNTGSPDGFHTATLLQQGETPAAKLAASPFAVPDADDSATALQLNGAALAPSPVGCGATAVAACSYDGTADVSSGPAPTAPGNDYFVTLNLGTVTTPVTVTFICLIHPGMQGTVTVVAAATAANTTADVLGAANAEYAADTSGALAAESAANTSSTATNSDGTHTITMTAGTASHDVEVLEMLPNNVTVHPGDTVKWGSTSAAEIHTVTFPNGSGSNSVDPLPPPVCETGAPPDLPPAVPGPPPSFGCASPAQVEMPLVPQPQGPTAIASTSTVATSGIFAPAPEGLPFPATVTFSFPNTGTFVYQCRIHDHMVGTITVVAATTPAPSPAALAQTGGVVPTLTAGSGSPGLIAGLIVALVAGLGGLTIAAARRRGAS